VKLSVARIFKAFFMFLVKILLKYVVSLTNALIIEKTLYLANYKLSLKMTLHALSAFHI